MSAKNFYRDVNRSTALAVADCDETESVALNPWTVGAARNEVQVKQGATLQGNHLRAQPLSCAERFIIRVRAERRSSTGLSVAAHRAISRQAASSPASHAPRHAL